VAANYRILRRGERAPHPDWERNHRGHLVRLAYCCQLETSLTLTVFQRRLGWSWCINQRGEATFSDVSYESEIEAIEAVEQTCAI
jgi:hypothetical protein